MLLSKMAPLNSLPDVNKALLVALVVLTVTIAKVDLNFSNLAQIVLIDK